MRGICTVKTVLLAGGFGTRISEESYLKPKPMLEIGGKPILWHIMKEYSHYGFNDFIICCGYKQHVIKEWFANYYLYNSDVTFDFSNENKMIVHNNVAEAWRVTLVDTGLETMTGGRIKRVKDYVGNETFMMTYGDGVSNIDISKLVEYHKTQGGMATITTALVEQRFGIVETDQSNTVLSFREKSVDDGNRVNVGYMVLEPEVFDLLEGDSTVFEKEPLQKMAKMGKLKAYLFDGYWQCMDTKREMDMLNGLWEAGKAPWAVWL